MPDSACSLKQAPKQQRQNIHPGLQRNSLLSAYSQMGYGTISLGNSKIMAVMHKLKKSGVTSGYPGTRSEEKRAEGIQSFLKRKEKKTTTVLLEDSL